MRYRLSHTTHYHYTEPVTLCHNEARMVPREEPGQQLHSYRVLVQPEPAALHERFDYFGNRTTYFEVSGLHRELVVTVESEVTTGGRSGQMGFAASMPWEDVRSRMAGTEGATPAESQYLLPSRLVPLGAALAADLAAWAAPCFPPGRPVLEAVTALNHQIHSQCRYDPRATTVSTPLAKVLAQQAGVCQDFAHLAIGCLRSLGLPAGYVSGYLETLPPPGREKLRGVDASHAWFSIFVPGQGWYDLDPTNDKPPDERYIVVARGRDYSDLPPLKGVLFGGGTSTLDVAVDVHEITPAADDSANHGTVQHSGGTP